jgi:hypothetical protein
VQLTFQPVVSALAAGNAVVIKSGSEECSPEFAKVAQRLVMQYLDNGKPTICLGVAPPGHWSFVGMLHPYQWLQSTRTCNQYWIVLEVRVRAFWFASFYSSVVVSGHYSGEGDFYFY